MISQDNKHLIIALNDGLTIHQVAQCLVRSTLDLGQLCGDQKVLLDEATGEPQLNNGTVQFERAYVINKWAKKKPYRFYSESSPTDSDIYNLDYGFDTSTSSGTAYYGEATVLSDLMNMIIANHGAKWTYLPPRGMKTSSSPVGQTQNEWFRLRDFDGYNHDAPVPFSVNWTNILAVATSHDPVQHDDAINKDPDAEIDVTTMKAFTHPDSDTGTMHLACAIKNGQYTRLFILNNPDPFGNDDYAEVPVKFFPGTNYCQFIYTDLPVNKVDSNGIIDAEISGEYQFLALPNSYQIYTLSTHGEQVFVDAIGMIGGFSQSGSNTKYFFRVITDSRGIVQRIETKGETASAININKYVTLYVEFSTLQGIEPQTKNGTEIAPAYNGGYVSGYVSTSNLTREQIEILLGGEAEASDLTDLYVRVWWTWDSGSKARYFNFEEKETYSISQSPYKLKISDFIVETE